MFLFLEKSFHSFIIEYDVSCGLLLWFYYVEVVFFFICSLLSIIIMKRVPILTDDFSASLRCFCVVFFLIHLRRCIIVINFCMLNFPCIPGTNIPLSWCIILLICNWICFVRILLRIFVLIFTCCSILFCTFIVVTLSGHGIQIMLASKNKKMFPLQFYYKKLK